MILAHIDIYKYVGWLILISFTVQLPFIEFNVKVKTQAVIFFFKEVMEQNIYPNSVNFLFLKILKNT